jgi:flavin reductase (DIM6/NTAB) family NADH-FMN oxidoreductase RutF
MNAHTAPAKKPQTDPELDPMALRNVMGQFATGVTVVTTVGPDGAPVGMAANSFVSVSLDPPLILWSIGLQAHSLAAFRGHTAFAINILCAGSKDLALRFARPSEDKFAGVAWTSGYAGVPVLQGAGAVLQCRTEQRLPGGDHEIYIGRVMDFHQDEKSPLLFHNGKFAKMGEFL